MSKGLNTPIIIFVVAGCVMLTTLVAWLFVGTDSKGYIGVLFAVAAFMMTLAQTRMQSYSGDIVIRRLHRMQILGGMAYIIAGLLMCNQVWRFIHYLHHNEWMVALAIGCLLQVYSAFRLPDGGGEA
ncbi:MAG: hypothetical protein HUK00_09595 [Bacteroidaceae bacterium]|nr:hypothetical protein [Bacteroidaceae bacterium]